VFKIIGKFPNISEQTLKGPAAERVRPAAVNPNEAVPDGPKICPHRRIYGDRILHGDRRSGAEILRGRPRPWPIGGDPGI